MKKYLFRFLTLALIVPALVSCAGQLEDNLPLAKKHTVYFSTVVGGQATRTGLTIDGNNVVPDWRFTDPEDVHVFEMDGTANAHLGTASSIDPYDNNISANFKADIDEEITIIVTPPSTPDPDGDGAKVLRQGSNTYGAVVAKSKEVEGKPVFFIPAVQTPDAETLKDPGAEFLVGYSRDGYDAITLDEEGTIVDLYFDRVAALSRIGFTNFSGEGEKVISVKINSQSSMTGSVKASDISFGNSNSVSWTPDTGEGAGVLTLSYGEGADIPTDKPFYAYFVSMPDTFNITSIEVLTDQYHYTKTVGQEVVFDLTSLKNLTADLSKNTTAEEIASNVWYKASVLEDGIDYLIVSQNNALKNNEGATAAVAVTPEDGIISFESATDPTIVWKATAHTENTGTNGQGGIVAGHFTLTNSDYYLQRTSSSEVGLKTTIPTDKPKYAVWDYDGTYLKHESSESQTFYFVYNDGWKADYTSSSHPGNLTPIQIYTTRAPQEPGFDPTGPFTFDIDQLDENPDANFSNEPELINYFGDVTYSSSDESIATVDASGDVTILKAGTVEIIATVAGDATHQAATASYLINITTSKTRVYNKVTSAADLEDGAQYILVYETASKAFKPILHSGGTYFTKGTDNALDVTISNGVIESPDLEDCHITLENGYYLYIASAGKYLYPGASGDSALGAEDKTSGHTVAISFSEGIVTIARTSDSRYHLYWSSSSYFSGISNTGSSYAANICLYKLEDNRPAWTMSFSPTAATYDLYTKEWTPGTPVLTSDATTAVTYTSSDETVATVNANGIVTPLKEGTATISAIAAADATHKRTVASYELTVEDSTPAKVYTRVESAADLTAGDKYLVVYESGSKVFKPILASSTSTTFTAATDNVLSATISNKTITSNDFVDCELTLEEGYYFYVESADKYLYPSASGIGAENPKDSGHSFSISISSGTASISRTSNSSTYRIMYYTGTNGSYFRSRNADANIALYKLEDNRPAWTMSYSPAEASYDLYTKEWNPGTPALTSDATTTITYTSSDESVATVDASGVVTPIKQGTVTISAIAAADATHKRTVVSYELTVDDSSPAKEYVRVESAADLEVGAKYLIVYESGSYVFKPYLESGSTTVFAKATDNKEAVTISDHKIVSNALDDWQITLETGYYLYVNSASKYLYPASSGGTALNAESSPTKAITISINNGIASISNSSYYFYYSTNSSWFSSTNTAANVNTALYKLDDGRQPQSISFSKSSAEYDLGTSSWTDAKPSIDLTGVHTTVTYESSDPTVATVTNDGEVTPLKKGTTKIVATAAASDTYKSATAEYTLTVKNSTLPVEYYTKVNSRDGLPGTSQTSATGNYIFVYEDGNKAYVFKAICDGTPTGAGNTNTGHVELTKEGSAIEVTLTDNGIEATDAVKACQLQLAHHSTASRNDWNIKPVSLGTYWIRVYNDGSSVRILAMTSAGYSGTFTFDGSGNNLEVKRTDSNRNAYWSYNATNNCFEATSTASKISVYQLSE